MRIVYRFCPRCGQPLAVAPLYGRERPHCPACGFIHFQNPRVAVAALVTEQACVLLVKRAVIPQVGFWALPAGFMDWDETPAAAAVREVAEETGVQVEVTNLLEIFPMPQGDGIVITYAARPLAARTLEPGDDVSDARWFAAHELPTDLAFESTDSILARWRQSLL